MAYDKKAGEKKDYSIDWSREMTLHSDTVASSSWTVETGLTQTTPAPTSTTTSTTIWLSGGTVGTEYTVTNTVTTAGGRILVQFFKVRVVAAPES